MYEAVKGSSARSAGQAPVYFAVTKTVRAPTDPELPILPVCLSASRVSEALAAGINTAFAGQLVQNATVETTYVQVGGACMNGVSVCVPCAAAAAEEAAQRRSQLPWLAVLPCHLCL